MKIDSGDASSPALRSGSRPSPFALAITRGAAAELAGEHGAGVPALAEALKISPFQVRDLLGEADQRPVLRLVGDG
ncbi:hypothetical protein [Demequina lutea]|uniref:Uncharacterized protein n=1 Tax=Demequina lutea TaxID=431489 RepID=A0A7Z0CIN3_9MICO|nr:hypothetical protein [Demequina lutea]NYI40138.1 hypothetical protein [Demequina lutea]